MLFTFFIYEIYASTDILYEEKITSEIVILDFDNLNCPHSFDQIRLKEEESTHILLTDHFNYPKKILSSYVVDLDVIEEVNEEDSLTFDDATINYTSFSNLRRNQLYDETTVKNNVTKYTRNKPIFKRYFANTGGLGLMTCLMLLSLVLLFFLIFLVPETLRLIFTVMIASVVLISVIIVIYYYWEWYTE